MKETHYKLKHRVTALFAAAVMLCSMLPGAAFAEEPTPQPTEETVQMEQQTLPPMKNFPARNLSLPMKKAAKLTAGFLPMHRTTWRSCPLASIP